MENIIKIICALILTLNLNVTHAQERTVLINTDSVQLIQDFYPTLISPGGSTTVLYVVEKGWANDTIGTPCGKITDTRFDGKYITLIVRHCSGTYSYFMETKINNKWVPYVSYSRSPRREESCELHISDDMFRIIGYKVYKNGIRKDFECAFDVVEKQYKYYEITEQRERINEKINLFLPPEFYPKNNRKRKE
jgi:hypothetical protein